MGSFAPPLWWLSIYISYLEFFCIENVSFLPQFMYLFNNSHIPMWTHEYLFYMLDNDSVLLILVHIVSALASGSSFSWFLEYNLILVSFCFLFELFLALQDAAGSCVCLSSQNLPFLQWVLFFLLESSIRNWDVGAMCAHCYWGVIASIPSELIRAKRCIYIYIYAY